MESWDICNYATWGYDHCGHTISPRIVAPAVINFEDDFARGYLWIFENMNILVTTSRSVIGMMHYFHIKLYPSQTGKIVYTTLGVDYSREENNRGTNTVEICLESK